MLASSRFDAPREEWFLRCIRRDAYPDAKRPRFGFAGPFLRPQERSQNYALKDLPQPHPPEAFGLLTEKPAPRKSSR